MVIEWETVVPSRAAVGSLTVETLVAASPGVPVWLVGWSFGADVSLATDHAAVAGWASVAPPLAVVDPAEMVAPEDARPKLLLSPEHDQYRAYPAAVEATTGWLATEVEQIDGVDHFLGGSARSAAERVGAWIAAR